MRRVLLMSDVWYTSDLHIGHRLVAGKRAFWDENNVTGDVGHGYDDPTYEAAPDPEEHDRTLAQNWDAVVKPDDQVWILGDISVSGKQHALDWIEQRPGIKHLVAGNHDPIHPQFRTAQKLLPHWNKYFETIQPFARRKIEGISFLLSHYPYMSWGDGPDRGPARDEQYRLPDLGMPLLHGHTHGTEREHGSMFHVGLDAWDLQLVPQSTIQEWIHAKKEEEVFA
jgi:calcineurin-like phosphoesterase family protein